MSSAPPPFQPLDELTQFAHWFLTSRVAQLRPPHFAVRDFGTVLSFVLYRRPPFQVELFINPPGDLGFPDQHRHPDVDTYEVHLSGELFFVKNGEQIATDDEVRAIAADGASLLSGQSVRVGPKDWHGATAGKEGAAFLSIQKWLNGAEPTSVGLNWEGNPAHPEQSKRWTEDPATVVQPTPDPSAAERREILRAAAIPPIGEAEASFTGVYDELVESAISGSDGISDCESRSQVESARSDQT